ncbi:MAG: hypothetical protein GF364_05475, partial [Candidatus Lokiarchaeota archaeon]|nr:hypothetical protein [Candidatus Lokiarchaeota archaeon]
IDSSEYKHYIFGLLFPKCLSDQFEAEYNNVKKAGTCTIYKTDRYYEFR